MGYWITVVDDEPFSLTHAKNLLRENLMRVTCLRSGADLLEFVKKHTPDLILLEKYDVYTLNGERVDEVAENG